MGLCFSLPQRINHDRVVRVEKQVVSVCLRVCGVAESVSVSSEGLNGSNCPLAL